MAYSDYVLYVDESGDHSLAPIDTDYQMFVLNFCVFRKDHHVQFVVPSLQRFKFKYFGHDIVVLHEREIRRQTGPFHFLKSRTKRDGFLNDLNQLINSAEFTIIAAAIRKDHPDTRFLSDANPYDLALSDCMDRAFSILRCRDQDERETHIIVEKRGLKEESDLKCTFVHIRRGENSTRPMPNFEMVFADKRTNSAGLQLADLTARPVGRHLLLPAQSNRAWEIINSKFWRSPNGKKDN